MYIHRSRIKESRSLINDSRNLEELKHDINNKGHAVTNIWNMRQRITLPIFCGIKISNK